MAKNKEENIAVEAARPVSVRGVILQAWLSIAVWMSFGLLLESLIGYRVPAYLRDELRRELFRLAHTHGALLNLVLLGAALCIDRELVRPSKMGLLSLRLGAIVMPVGFLLGGIWHTEGEPGIGVWLAPMGGVLVILGAVDMAISAFKNNAKNRTKK
jgi:uncharacterized membrane protein YgdD (TMEM256/DUF423 family)